MNSDEIEASISTLTNATSDMRVQISGMNEQISGLKQKVEKPKTPMDNIKEYAGVVSLVLGLVISAFTIYDNAVTKPADAREARHLWLENTLASITSLQQEFFKAQQTGNPSPEVLSVLAGRLNDLVDAADKVTSKQKGLTSFRDEIALGDASQSDGRNDKASVHYEIALRLAEAPSEKAEAEARDAAVECAAGKREDAEKHFSAAIQVMGSLKDSRSLFFLPQVYANRALCECNAGDIAAGNNSRIIAFRIMEQAIAGAPPPYQAQIVGVRQALEQRLASSPCGPIK
jgi:tetratricopeptide (TPR) repeat protein